MRNALLLLSVPWLAMGCIIIDEPGPGVNTPPRFDAVDARIRLASTAANDTLRLEANVFDSNGLGDIAFVYAEVFDDVTGQLVDDFDLFATSDPTYYESEWLVRSTYLIPDFYADYSIDFIVEDFAGDLEVVTVLPAIF